VNEPKETKRVAPRALDRLLNGQLLAETGPLCEVIDGTLVFCDVSGFTAATETLGRKGRIGAELMNELISLSFSGMLDFSESLGGDLLAFGGDALFLLFDGSGHVERGLHAAVGMRRLLRSTAQARRSVAPGITLTMSTGIHTGDVWLGAVGSRFPLLVPAGPSVTRVLQLEREAKRGEILVSQPVIDALANHSKRSVSFVATANDPTVYILETLGRGHRHLPSYEFAELKNSLPQNRLLDSLLADLVVDANLLEHRDAAIAFVRCDGLDHLSSHQRLSCLDALVEQTAAEAAIQGVCLMASDVAEGGVKLMLGGGLPTIRGEDADRLVSTLRAAVEPIQGVRLAAGAQAGQLLSGFVGSSTRRVYTCVGDAVNSAARITSNALSGEVVIGDTLADRLRSSWKLGVRKPFAAKGKRDLVHTRSVVDRMVPKAGVTSILPFVGRDHEMAAIRRGLTAPNGWVEISGAPGSGKSRLLHETVLSDPDMRTLQCFGDPTASESPYQTIAPALLEWVAGHHEAALVGERELERRLATLRLGGDDIGETLTDAIRRVFGVDGGRGGTAAVDRRVVHRVVIDLLRQIDSGPTALIIEDAHWLDASSAELIFSLRASSLDVRIISTRRLEGQGLLASGHVVEQIDLVAIDDDALVTAASEVASEIGVTRTELKALVIRSEGNPLVVELLLDARARGLSSDNLPPRAEELAGRLLDSLLPIHRHLLGVAAVCGAGSDTALVGAVAGLAQHQVESQFALISELAEISTDSGTVRFRHALVRDAAYARLPFKERFALHARVATTVERTKKEFNDVPLLAYHFHQAGDHRKAWRYGRDAGGRAAAADAPIEAAAMYRRALENAYFLDDVHFVDLIQAWEALGAAEQRNGKPSEAETAFSTAFDLTHLLQAELLRERGRVAADTRRLSVATRWYAKARRTAMNTNGRRRDQFLTGVDVDSAAIRYRQGKFGAAERTLLDAAKSARRLRDDRRLAHGLYLLASVSVELGRIGADSYGEEAARLYEGMGDKLGLARTLNNLGVVQQLTGDWNEALATYQRSATAFMAAGDSSGAAIIHNNIGEILSDQGQFEQAEIQFALALETWHESGFKIGIALATSNRGRLRGRVSCSDDGRELLNAATESFASIGGWDFFFEARLRLAELALRIRDHQSAHALLTEIPDTMLEAAKLPGRAAQRARLRGIVAAQRGESAAALEFFQISLERAEQAQNVFERACTAQAIAELAHIDGEIAEKYRRVAHDSFEHLDVAQYARRSF
jgi:class 3 adenylate cyclase/tetratricopeptide (TPR) repeat protein